MESEKIAHFPGEAKREKCLYFQVETVIQSFFWRECMFEVVRDLILSKDVCVMATVNKDKPYCSLMAYAPDDECRHLYMATRSDTRKWLYLQENPNASLLIDSRDEDIPTVRFTAKALTITGRREELTEADRARATELLAARHAHLAEFLQDPLVEVICIRCESFLLLEGVSKSHYIEMPKKR